MFSRRITSNVLLAVVLFVGFAETAQAKSLYDISDTYTSQLRAYKITGTSLVYQTNYVCRSAPGGGVSAVGIAIDESDYGDFLFVTFEWTGDIEIVNAKSMQYVDTKTATGASDLAGIVVDQGNSKIYVMDRYTNRPYSYSWDPSSKTLIPDFDDPYYTELQGMEYGWPKGAYGIALDKENGRLYVADNTSSI
jgi:DNA-binding beta-propeller fold protein YncE